MSARIAHQEADEFEQRVAFFVAFATSRAETLGISRRRVLTEVLVAPDLALRPGDRPAIREARFRIRRYFEHTNSNRQDFARQTATQAHGQPKERER